MRSWWLVVVMAGFAPVACTNTETDTNADADTDADADADFDPFEGLVENPDCETVTSSDGSEVPVAGATTWWRGNLRVESNGDVSGTEYWVLYPNDKWTDAEDFQNCALVFNLVGGTTTDTPGCASCDIGVEMHAEMDKSASSCIERFENFMAGDGYGSFDEAYSVNEQGESGAITLFFPSGNEFAAGEKNGKVWTYETTPACRYF